MAALSYRQVLNQYDQSTAGGDQRTLPQYAQDMNDLYGTDMFSEGQRDGWWTRASTRADQYLENSLAGRASGAVGGWAGSLFGRQEQGEEIGRGLPRSLLNMAPLAAEGAAEILSGGAATPIVAPAVAATLGLAGTGAMFGGHTYAQTGSARNAVISGATAMALPGLAHLGGSLGLAAAGAPLARGLLTDVGGASGAFGRKAVGDFVSSRLASTPGEFLSQYGGSQAAMFAGSAASAKLQNPDESVFSKDFATDFLLGQIPFTAMDVYHGARTLGTKTLIRADGSRVDINGLPTREQVGTFAKPEEVTSVGKPFEPSIGTPEEQANLQAVLQGHDEIAKSDMKSGTEKSAAILGLTRTVDDPKGAAALRAATGSPEVTVRGWTNGTNRIVVDEHNGIQNLPEHKTVFFDPAKVKNFQASPDGEVSFTAPQNTLKPADFPLHRPFRDPNVQELPQQPKPVEKMPFATHDQIEHDPFFTEDKPTTGVSPEDDGREPTAQLQKIREAAPVTPELKAKAVAMGGHPAVIEGMMSFPSVFHGTRIDWAQWDTQKGGGLINVAFEDRPFAPAKQQAEVYANGGGGAREQLTKENSHFTTDDGKYQWNEQEQLFHLVEGNKFAPKTLTQQEAEKLESSWEGSLAPKQPIIKQLRAEGVRPLDLRKKENKEKFAQLLRKADITNWTPMQKTVRKGLINDLEAGNSIWSWTKLEASSQLFEEHLNPLLEQEGFNALIYSDDAHDTLALFHDNQLTQQAQIKEAVHAHDMAVQREKDAKELAARKRTPEENVEILTPKEKVVSATVVFVDGTIAEGPTHAQAFNSAIEKGVNPKQTYEQGFKTTKGRLVSRREAHMLMGGTEDDPQMVAEDYQLTEAKKQVEKNLAKGQSPTQAIEHASLEALSKETDSAMLDQSVQKEVVKRVTEEEARKEKELEAASKDVEYLNSLTPEELAKETKRRTERADKFDSVERTQYAEKAVENESGGRKNLPSREEAEAFRIEHAQTEQRDPDDFEVRNGGPGKFYLVEKLNRKISLDIKDSGGHERVGEQARQDEEELKKDASAESVEAPSPVSSNTATLQLMKELGEWTPKQYADATDGDVAAAIPVIRDAKAALEAVAKGQEPTAEQGEALKKVRNQHLRLRSYDLGSKVPVDMELVKEMGVSHGDYLPAFDWYAKNNPSDYMSSLFLDLKRLAKDMLHSVGWTNDFEPGWHYLPAEGEGLPAQINVPHLPTSRDPGDVLGWVGNLAHEITHHITKDLAARTDEAAVAFRKTLDELSTELRKSKIIPKDVRDAIEEARKTNAYSQHANGTIKIQDWFDARVSKKSQEWLGVFYGLLNHDEFVSQVFGDKNFTNLLAMTKRVVNKTFTERLMDRFARAWTTLTGLKAGHENALADVLTKFADYLGKPKDYNTMDLMRDKLISQGVRPDALASRIFTVKNMLKTGSLDESVKGWKRENANELLPATAEYGDPAFTLDLPPLAIRKAVLDLDPELIPAHDDLSLRLSHDLEVVRAVLKETGMDAPEGLAKNVLRVQQMRQGVKQYQRAQVRWDNVNNFDGGTEWRDRIAGRLRGIDTPHPSDPTGNHDLAQELLGLSRPMVATESAADVRARTSIDMMKRGKMSVLKDFLEKNFLLDQHFAQIYRAHAGRHDALQLAMASAFEKAQILATAYGFDPKNPGKVSDAVVKNNVEVTTNPRLNEAASNVHRFANVLQQGGAAAPWTHPDIQALVSHLSSAEREKVKNNYAAVMHRNMVNADVVWPRYFDEMTPKEVGLTIAAREGVLPDSAEAVARDLYTALKEVRQPETAASGSAKLQQIASTLSPATAVKAIDQTNAAINFAEQHIAFLRTRSQYTSEQRYGKLQAVLLDGKGKSIRVSADDDAALLKLVAKQQAAGARLLFRDEKQPGQFGGINETVISQFENMEQQRALRMQAALKDAPADVQAAVLEPGSMANELRDSLSSLQPLPGTSRKFSQGRETLNMLEQGDAFFGRQSNWMRHKLARASDALARLHPEIAGNLELKKFGDQKLEAFLTPDNEWARKLTSATFFYKLAFEFGNTFLEGFQHLTTGMQQLISETGSVGDAAALTAKASKDFWTAKTTGKWASEEQRLAMKWFAEHGHDQASAWNDIHDPDTMSLRLANSAKGLVGKTLAGVDAASKKLSGTVQGYGNRIGLLAGFELARSKGMSFDEATKFAVDSKNLGMYTGGKAQRSGLWRIKTKAVPQLLSSLQTYTQGWFGQMYTDYVRGFSQNRPQGLSRAQIEGSKKAFLYGIAAQATLAGALGLPGVGQGLALLQQASGVDLKGWTRGHLQDLFDEDNESGGLITGMAMNGVLAGVSPFDPSNRASIGVPYIGVTSQKGFDISSLAGAPVATAGDFAKGLFAAASGQRTGWETALPNVLRRPARLAADDWDVRDKRGGLLYSLSSAERAMTLLGLPPSRIQRARDVAQAAKNAQDQVVAQKEQMADSLAKMFTEQGPQAVQKRLVELKGENPDLDLTSLVKSIAQRRVRQTTPYDWRRETNPGAELAGLNVYNPSTVALGRQMEQQTTSALGLRTPPNPHADAEALAVDHLLNTGAAKTEAEAKKMLERRGRPNRLVIPGL